MDADEREVRMLAVEILMLVNRGGHTKDDIRLAVERLEQTARALRPEPRPAEATG